MFQISVVVLNFKVKKLTLRCVKSVQASTYENLKIYVVDNNSGDRIGADLAQYKDIVFIQNNKNLGYAAGNNVGIKRALEEGADYIFILNPDTEVEKSCIKILAGKIEKYDAGIVNPKIYFGDKKTLWFAGKKFDVANVMGVHIGVDEKDEGQYDEDKQLDDITGAALLIKREVFEKIGLFDERYFLYYEDSDFAFRAKYEGFKMMYIYSALVYHENAQSTGLGSPVQNYFITRNRMLFALKFLSLRVRFALLREALRNIGDPVKRLALWDFFTGNFGKGSFLK